MAVEIGLPVMDAAINASQQFWLADAALAASITGKPISTAMSVPAASGSGAAAGH